LARTAIRQAILERKYKTMLEEAKREEAMGLSNVIKNKEELDAYLDRIAK